MPYLTPSEIPEETNCRILLVPASYEWDAVIYGALSELTLPYNWELFGAVSVGDAVVASQAILDGYAVSTCGDIGYCELLDGDLTLRLGIGGHVEQWRDGEWQTPDGDYE